MYWLCWLEGYVWLWRDYCRLVVWVIVLISVFVGFIVCEMLVLCGNWWWFVICEGVSV